MKQELFYMNCFTDEEYKIIVKNKLEQILSNSEKYSKKKIIQYLEILYEEIDRFG